MSSDRQIEIDRVRQIEAELINLPQVDMQTSSLIHGEMYARTVFIPAGTVVTGALTNLDNICIVNGDISVTTDEGMRRIVGFHVLPASKGYKRIGYAHGDTYWTMVCHTNAKTIEDAENDATSEPHILQTRRDGVVFDWASRARADYNLLIRELGFTLAFIDAQMRRTDDLMETEACFRNAQIGKSEIHGLGVFASRDILQNESIAPARRDRKRCIAGRFTNHSHLPNAVFVATGVADHADMVALCDIPAGLEITVDYRSAYRTAMELEAEAKPCHL
jgi:hypothetical protein